MTPVSNYLWVEFPPLLTWRCWLDDRTVNGQQKSQSFIPKESFPSEQAEEETQENHRLIKVLLEMFLYFCLTNGHHSALEVLMTT